MIGTIAEAVVENGYNMAMGIDVEVRQIEAEAALSGFARGWHCLGLVKDVGDGNSRQILAFGKTLVVVFRAAAAG
ncbi:hypothetical protein SAMN04489835_3872 [Mycolicibacterium rutilum]|uniref:Uncharacterized protein n=1 Tax=Mycolicibacterium rutilum TaxID=370526 RepID=A0A1H6KYC0_MYCRU|nr:hypothetical protein SAMN04489835_3872 [Mycolicibacterium rutilum]